jgi:hypothetical protein
MAYKNFVAGEEALAVDVNSYLMSQTVSRFANATQRTAQVTAPVLNQLTVLDDRTGQVQYWTGSAWADLLTPAPPVSPLPAGFHLQSGNVVTTTDAFGSFNVTFPVAFTGQPVIVGNEAGNLSALATVIAYTNSTVTFNIRRNLDDVPVANSTVRMMYVATGQR